MKSKSKSKSHSEDTSVGDYELLATKDDATTEYTMKVRNGGKTLGTALTHLTTLHFVVGELREIMLKRAAKASPKDAKEFAKAFAFLSTGTKVVTEILGYSAGEYSKKVLEEVSS